MGAGSISQREERSPAYADPRPEVAALVPPAARRVLDLACRRGDLGASLKARGAVEVVGIEGDGDLARQAEAVLDRVIAADVSSLPTDGLGRFDCLVAAGVLENLADPWGVLRRFASLLEPGCRAVLSLPNARHWEVLWQLGVRGRWPRRPGGIFEARHLRWFPLAEVYGLCSFAGLALEQVERVPRPRVPAWTATTPGVRAFGAFEHVVAARRY